MNRWPAPKPVSHTVNDERPRHTAGKPLADSHAVVGITRLQGESFITFY